MSYSGGNPSPPPPGDYSPSHGQPSTRSDYPATSNVRVGHQPSQHYPQIAPPIAPVPPSSDRYSFNASTPRSLDPLNGPPSHSSRPYPSWPHIIAAPPPPRSSDRSSSRPKSSMRTSPTSVSTSSGERFVCEVCGKDFSRVHDRKRHHEMQHAPSVSHTCIYCGKDFSRPDSLKRHIQNGCDQAPQ
ncbi:hypothetical protein B0H10DRAFT_2110471 [Mycena sp. CBHHK59/15]|nr:hypothetical protein B0H10DRAFT_2110471 [Mycena sp. CBHHK59/15]